MARPFNVSVSLHGQHGPLGSGEGILRKDGAGRMNAYSAGVNPRAR